MNSVLSLPASPAIEKYRVLDVKSYMTLEEARTLSVELARRFAALPERPTCVVGLANGAIFTACIVAEELGVPLHIVLIRRRGSRIKQKLGYLKRQLRIPSRLVTWGPLMPLWRLFERRTSALHVASADFDFELAGASVALVDDCIVSGASLQVAADRLRAAGAASVTSGVLCWYRGIGDSGDRQPDIHLHQFVHFYPWSSSSMHYGAFLRWIAERGLALRD